MWFFRFLHLFGHHSPDMKTMRQDKDFNTIADCKVCGIELTGRAPWE